MADPYLLVAEAEPVKMNFELSNSELADAIDQASRLIKETCPESDKDTLVQHRNALLEIQRQRAEVFVIDCEGRPFFPELFKTP